VSKQITLMGGLGNQLFQYARALTDKADNYLVDLVSSNRRTSANLPDLSDFKLVDSVQILEVSKSFIQKSKLLNAAIRLSAKTRDRNMLFSNVEALLQFQTLLTQGRFVKFRVANGLDDLCEMANADCYIGYFQHYRAASFLQNAGLELNSPSTLEQEYLIKSQSDFPLIVHYRLTDYLLQESFGTPNSSYYSEAIKFQWESGRYGRIWIFSDDIQKAKEMFPGEYLDHSVFVNEPSASPAEILQVMRLGSGYVIANSSYSWWAASLSRTVNPVVVSPEPWFASFDSPGEILQPTWVKMKSNFQHF
jgi:hypothetical protein